MPYVTMQGASRQTVVDADITEVRATGARQDKFQAIIPAYIRLEQNPLWVVNNDLVGPWAFEAAFGGKSSGIALKWQVVKTDTGGGILDTNLEWYVPPFFPPMFDEEMEIKLRSTGLGQVLVVEYIMYYTIKTFTEMEMVQALESYPVGIV